MPEIRSSSVLLKAAKLRAESILNNEDYNSQETKSGILFITDVLKQVSYQKDGTVTEDILEGVYDKESYQYMISNSDGGYKNFILQENLIDLAFVTDEKEINGCTHAVTLGVGVTR